MMVLKSIGVFSLGKVMGCVQAVFGLIIGAFFTMIALAGVAAGGKGGVESLLFGVGAIIFFPLFSGIGGFIGGVITAVIYNVVLAMVGGLELEFETSGRFAAEEDDYE